VLQKRACASPHVYIIAVQRHTMLEYNNEFKCIASHECYHVHCVSPRSDRERNSALGFCALYHCCPIKSSVLQLLE
jgi:hypothetical protein